jgi:hypothetical protein
MTGPPMVTFRLRTRAQAEELNRWMSDLMLGTSSDRADLGDQLFVRQILVELARQEPPQDPAEFELRADRAIAEAKELGMFVPLFRFGLSSERISQLQAALEANS